MKEMMNEIRFSKFTQTLWVIIQVLAHAGLLLSSFGIALVIVLMSY